MHYPPNYPTSPAPRRPRRNLWRWYRSRGRLPQIALGCGSLVALLVVGFVCSAAVAGIVQGATGSQTPTPASVVVAASASSASPTSAPTHALTATPNPTATPTPTPKPVPTRAPQPTATPKPSCNAVNNNPWCYNFSPGNLIYYPPDGFCNYFNCIASFYGADDPGDGYIIECQDGTYSQSGGESGSCSHHGGNLRPLYSH